MVVEEGDDGEGGGSVVEGWKREGEEWGGVWVEVGSEEFGYRVGWSVLFFYGGVLL